MHLFDHLLIEMHVNLELEVGRQLLRDSLDIDALGDGEGEVDIAARGITRGTGPSTGSTADRQQQRQAPPHTISGRSRAQPLKGQDSSLCGLPADRMTQLRRQAMEASKLVHLVDTPPVAQAAAISVGPNRRWLSVDSCWVATRRPFLWLDPAAIQILDELMDVAVDGRVGDGTDDEDGNRIETLRQWVCGKHGSTPAGAS